MSDAFISNIVTIGNWGVGKSGFLSALTPLIQNEKGIKKVVFDSDRYHFEDVVRADTRGGERLSDGSILGSHSIMVQDGPRGSMRFRVLDGSIFNNEHRKMLQDLVRRESGVVRLIEYATGPTSSFQEGEKLDQSGRFAIKQLITSGAIHSTLLIELGAPYDLRERRNRIRKDRVDEKAFELYGQPGGEVEHDDAIRLGNHFLRAENHVDGIDQLAERIFKIRIQPYLLRDDVITSQEGQSLVSRETEGR